MDSNKDEGRRCFEIGQAALERGDKVRAVKFLTKAHRLFPTPQVDALLKLVNGEDGKQGSEETTSENGDVQRPRSTANDDGESSASHDSRAHRQSNGVHQSNGSSASGPTVEQVEVVRRVRRTKDFYEILGVSKTCTEEEVRKAYRKLSLKVHPDKNKAQGAEEAFKAVSKAFMCLSNAERRAKYDQCPEAEDGTEAVQQNPFMRRRHGNPTYYEDVFDANDIFNSFFFSENGAFRRVHVRTQGPRGGRTDTPSNNLLGLLQLLPIIALFALTYFPFSRPVYSLDQVSPYDIPQVTIDHGIQYYVRSPTFEKDYPVGSQSRRSLEFQVESDFKEYLVQKCKYEMMNARRWRVSRAQQLAESPACVRLEQQLKVRVYY